MSNPISTQAYLRFAPLRLKEHCITELLCFRFLWVDGYILYIFNYFANIVLGVYKSYQSSREYIKTNVILPGTDKALLY